MKKLLAAIALAATAVSSTGCFTAAGAIIGSQSKTHESVRLADGSHIQTEGSNAVTGALIGAVIDVALIYAASQASLSNCFTYGPGEGGGDTACYQ